MIRSSEIWDIIKERMLRNELLTLQDVYDLVSRNWQLDDEDFESQSPTSDLPKWKRNVRNVLQYRKRTGEIEWDGNANYRII